MREGAASYSEKVHVTLILKNVVWYPHEEVQLAKVRRLPLHPSCSVVLAITSGRPLLDYSNFPAGTKPPPTISTPH
jgi:hypothetical protein